MEAQDLYAVSKTATVPQALVEQESQRAVAEVQAAMVIARRFPRDVKAAVDNIMVACQRPGLAEAAVYEYARGGTAITGPSIRLAEAIAQAWGNMQVGIRELEQRNGESTVQAYAWDLETNLKEEKTFQVKHIRHTKKQVYALEDPRDIYELAANQGARRLRACILSLIPGDVVEAAVLECEATMKAKADVGPDGQGKLLKAFASMGVTKEQIEKRIQRRIDTITAAQMVGLRKIFNSLKDGMSQPADWFEVEAQGETKKTGSEAAKEALRQKVGKGKAQAEDVQPGAAQEAIGPGKVNANTGEVFSRDEFPGTHVIQCTVANQKTPLSYCRTECQRIDNYRECPDYIG